MPSHLRGSLIIKLLLSVMAMALVVVAVFMPTLSCQGKGSGLQTVRMQIGNTTFTLEVADTYALRQQGLMNRDSLPAKRGMIFVFAREQQLGFWMKNTRIALDIIYVNGGGQVVSIRQMRPYDLRSVPSGSPAQFAIEVNQGAAAEAGVKVGDQLIIPKEASTAQAEADSMTEGE